MSTWLNLAAVAIGGALGSVLRFLFTVAATAIPGGSTLWGTTACNLLGCAAIGAVAEYCLIEEAVSERVQLAIRVGFLGGLTTFSTFAAESMLLVGNGRWWATAVYLGANVALGLAALSLSAYAVRQWMS